MDAKGESPEHVIHRFAWLDNNTFRIISHEGIERIVDINDNFKELEFNVIPMYKKKFCQK
jgi:hypothetical protein